MPTVARLAVLAALLATLALLTATFVGGRRHAPTDTVPGSDPVPLTVSDGAAGTTFTKGARFITGDPFPVRITFSGPEGWEGNVGGPYAAFVGTSIGDESVMFNLSISPYLDPCHWDQGTVNPPPTTVAGIVDALDAMRGVEVTDPATTIGGRPATLLTATAPGSLADCTQQAFNLWQLPLGAIIGLPPGAVERIWVVDAGAAGPLVIGTVDQMAWPPQVRAATEQLLDSLEIEPSS